MLRRCSVSARAGVQPHDEASARLRIAPHDRRLRLGLVAFDRLGCTPAAATRFAALRVYIRPHFRKCSPVAALKLRLVPPTATRPLGFPKQALCKVAFAGYGRTAVGASRSLARPTRRRLHALVLVVAPGHWSGASRCVLVSGLSASNRCVPPPARRGLAAAQHWPHAPACPSAPQGGALSPAQRDAAWRRRLSTAGRANQRRSMSPGIVLQFNRASSPCASPP